MHSFHMPACPRHGPQQLPSAQDSFSSAPLESAADPPHNTIGDTLATPRPGLSPPAHGPTQEGPPAAENAAASRLTRPPHSSQTVSVATPRTILLCGADLLESFVRPGVWKEAHVREILSAHGVVCVAR